jgi:NAD(P)-dependent dehydrogenase (short-subunit alcohol dehydrogenase family)
MATIVMTGGTAGLGRLAARRLLRSPNRRLLLGARSSAPPGAEALALEKTKLDNVRCFAVRSWPLDNFVKNAPKEAVAAALAAAYQNKEEDKVAVPLVCD